MLIIRYKYVGDCISKSLLSKCVCTRSGAALWLCSNVFSMRMTTPRCFTCDSGLLFKGQLWVPCQTRGLCMWKCLIKNLISCFTPQAEIMPLSFCEIGPDISVILSQNNFFFSCSALTWCPTVIFEDVLFKICSQRRTICDKASHWQSSETISVVSLSPQT